MPVARTQEVDARESDDAKTWKESIIIAIVVFSVRFCTIDASNQSYKPLLYWLTSSRRKPHFTSSLTLQKYQIRMNRPDLIK